MSMITNRRQMLKLLATAPAAAGLSMTLPAMAKSDAASVGFWMLIIEMPL